MKLLITLLRKTDLVKQMPGTCFLLCICMTALFCGKNSRPNKIKTESRWVSFDSLLTHYMQSSNLVEKIHCDIRDTIIDLDDERVTFIEFVIDNNKFIFKSRDLISLDTSISEMKFNNIEIQYLYDENGSIVPVDHISGLDMISDSILILNPGETSEKIIMARGYYPDAYGKFSYVERGLILHLTKNKCFGYLLSGDIHLPDNFYPNYDPTRGVIRYLRITIDTDAIDMDTEETYTITPFIIDLYNHKFEAEKNNRGKDKVLIVKSKNYYENARVKIVEENW